MRLNLAFIGFGVVGQGLAEILCDKKDYLIKQYNAEFQVVAISDMVKGSIYEPKGLDLNQILKVNREAGMIESYDCENKGWDSIQTIEETNADIIVEVTYTDIQTGEPATSHIKAAFKNGKHVVTSNKGPVALAYHELKELAKQNRVQFKFEGTVLSGTPIINLALNTLAGNDIREIRGILNGTTNYMLTEMEKGKSYDAVLKHAQELGYAEAKPDADVKGYDALAKVVILANTLMGGELKPDEVSCEGITGIDQEDILNAKKEGYRFKLIGSVKKDGGEITGRVEPIKISADDPLYAISGPTNALTFVTDLLGETTIVGAGAGKTPTGFSLLSDILEIHKITSYSNL